MTTQTKDNKWQCDMCGFRYNEKDWAEKCQAWCTEHKSCNIEIIAHGEPSVSSQ